MPVVLMLVNFLLSFQCARNGNHRIGKRLQMLVFERVRIKVLSTTFFIASLSACGGGGSTTPQTSDVGMVQMPKLSGNPINLTKGITIGSPFWLDGSSPTGGRGTSINGVNCLVTEDYHIHTHLAIIKNGQMLAIPPNIGLQGCAYELHTHDKSGILHIETSTYRKFTLGQFFAVWGQPLSYANIAGISGMPVVVFINDGEVLTEYKGDLAEIELKSHRAITIQIGTALKEIPSYKWDPNL